MKDKPSCMSLTSCPATTSEQPLAAPVWCSQARWVPEDRAPQGCAEGCSGPAMLVPGELWGDFQLRGALEGINGGTCVSLETSRLGGWSGPRPWQVPCIAHILPGWLATLYHQKSSSTFLWASNAASRRKMELLKATWKRLPAALAAHFTGRQLGITGGARGTRSCTGTKVPGVVKAGGWTGQAGPPGILGVQDCTGDPPAP